MKATAPAWLLAAACTAYVLVPGPPGALIRGIPIGQTGIVLLVLVNGAWLWTRSGTPRVDARWIAVVVLAALLKAGLASVVPPAGWTGRYYANESFTPPFEPSMDFPGLDATRIDPRVSFQESEFPVHFFNDRLYNTGILRENVLPFSVQWVGYMTIVEPETFNLRLVAAGRAELIVDAARRARTESASGASVADASIALTPGTHRLEVRYQKPADTVGQIRLEHADGRVFEKVSPYDTPQSSVLGRAVPIAVWGLHVLAAGAVLIALWPGLRHQRGARWIPVAVVALLVTQGLWKSRHLVGRVWTLSGGDDWLNYEMSARDVVLNGLMMTQGGVIGRGQPFSLYPGYAYFVALVHAITGESLAGVVLVNFLMLAVATLVAYGIARRLFAPAAALGGLAWLLLIEQLDFVRYYTVTLFSENLYFPLVAATVLFLIVHHQNSRKRDLILAAVFGALASWTRPSMMLLLPFAAGSVFWVRGRAQGPKAGFIDTALLVGTWMAAIAPITIRNYIMSGRAVLLTAGQGATFVAYNMPVPDPMYFKGFDGTLFNSAQIMARMFLDHPIASLTNYGTKLGFSLGIVHWMGSGRMHPELILTTVGYGLGIVLLKPLRSAAATPLHAFIVTHVATLMLTMPSNYGYRMILPAFVFMALAAGALVGAPLAGVMPPRWVDRRAAAEASE